MHAVERVFGVELKEHVGRVPLSKGANGLVHDLGAARQAHCALVRRQGLGKGRPKLATKRTPDEAPNGLGDSDGAHAAVWFGKWRKDAEEEGDSAETAAPARNAAPGDGVSQAEKSVGSRRVIEHDLEVLKATAGGAGARAPGSAAQRFIPNLTIQQRGAGGARVSGAVDRVGLRQIALRKLVLQCSREAGGATLREPARRKPLHGLPVALAPYQLKHPC